MLFAVLQGTSAEQDNRFSNKQKKLLKQLKFAECLEKKVSGMGEWGLKLTSQREFAVDSLGVRWNRGMFSLKP